MNTRLNRLGQPVGSALPNWRPARRPPRTAMEGRSCIIEPLDPARHGDALFAAFSEDRDGRLWTYLAFGPFPTRESFDSWMQAKCLREDPFYHAIVDRRSGAAVGIVSYMRIDRGSGVIERANSVYSPRAQRSTLKTETTYLMMRRVFDELGYRRYECRCDSLNEASRKAILRSGFTQEGLFRQARVYKGRTRDTLWFSILDHEWPAIRSAHEAWLSESNFDVDGRQRESLGALQNRFRVPNSEPGTTF